MAYPETKEINVAVATKQFLRKTHNPQRFEKNVGVCLLGCLVLIYYFA